MKKYTETSGYLYAKLCGNTLYRRYYFFHYSLFSHLNSSISLPLPLYIEFPVPSQKSELSCIFVSGVTLSIIVLSILELLRQCSMFYFSFYLYLKCWLLKLIFEDFFQILNYLERRSSRMSQSIMCFKSCVLHTVEQNQRLPLTENGIK